MRDVNLDRLRELAGHLRNALRQLREVGAGSEETFLSDPLRLNSAKSIQRDLGDFDRYLARIGQYLKADLC